MLLNNHQRTIVTHGGGSQPNQTMKKLTALSFLAAGLSLASSTFAQTNTLQIYTAIEVEYQTEVGKSYALQGSLDMLTWINIGNPVLGNGQVEDRIFSTKNAGSVNYASYRLSISPGPTNGCAPWTIAGLNLAMDDSSSSNAVQYLSETNGQDVYSAGNDPFSYSYARISANTGHAERLYSPDRHDSIDYTFIATNSGSWVREEYEHGVLKNRNVGSFHYAGSAANSPGGTNPPPVITQTLPPAPPSTFTNLIYYAFTGATPDKYQFNGNNTGTATPGTSSGEVEVAPTGNTFTYTYSVLSSNTASLIINFGYYGIGGDRQEYDLTFNDGSSALFNRRIYRLGSLFTTDQGVFTPNAVLTPPTPPNTNGAPATPPGSPAGFTYTMNDSSTPPRVVFQTATSGTEFDDSAPSSFTYTYTQTDTNTFHLVVTFKPGKYDDYVLTFATAATGNLVLHSYDKNALKRTASGSFAVAATTP